MNIVTLMGRLTRDPEVRYSTGENANVVAKYTLAVDRKPLRKGEEKTSDFINCVAFGKKGEFAEKYLRKGLKIIVIGSIRTDNYINKKGEKVFTMNVIVEKHEFAESKSGYESTKGSVRESDDGFLQIPDYLDDELPFR